jgi:hypothetical protein
MDDIFSRKQRRRKRKEKGDEQNEKYPRGGEVYASYNDEIKWVVPALVSFYRTRHCPLSNRKKKGHTTNGAIVRTERSFSQRGILLQAEAHRKEHKKHSQLSFVASVLLSKLRFWKAGHFALARFGVSTEGVSFRVVR